MERYRVYLGVSKEERAENIGRVCRKKDRESKTGECVGECTMTVLALVLVLLLLLLLPSTTTSTSTYVLGQVQLGYEAKGGM